MVKVGRIRKTMMQKRRSKNFQIRSILFLIIFNFFLSGCDVFNFDLDFFSGNSSNIQDVESDQPDMVATVEQTAAPTRIPIEDDVISIWMQPDFDPDSNNRAAEQLKIHLENYLDENSGVKIDYRLKGADGANSILQTLSITADAAPDALPTVVLLSRKDMEEAASLGLIRPIDFFADVFENNDWYPFAVEMGIYKNEMYGLPFASDVMVMATKNGISKINYVPLTSQPIQFGEIGFAAGNPKSLLPYLWYQSAGGKFLTESGPIKLEEEALFTLFTTIIENRNAGNFNFSLTQYTSQDDLWEAYTDGDLESVIIWSSKLLANSNESAMTFIPSIGNAPYTYADGWVWCLVQKDTSDMDRNIDFMQYIVSPEFLQEWTPETNYVPVRRSTTDFMNIRQPLIDDLLLSADIIPPVSIRGISEQILHEEVLQLLQGKTSPELATQTVLALLEEAQQSE